ncbi:NAD(P)/FAD-dependent oxidoreductase [Paraburkholderia sp. J67]|uniref:NAD(P)/FAD-dependent oxidoreductase n=1 Tax=Paraburkholderia sp. J67 TaxID=2805435 RepID=UPI002ABEA052|nr:FAD-dependent oxidoreductase [Paraburkholderia sp. J67]
MTVNDCESKGAGMEAGHCVIVGGGHAVAQLTASLRQEGWTGPITLVSAETVLPYHRPPLSKAFLCGNDSDDTLLIRPREFYEKQAIDVRLGVRAQAIDRNARRLTLDDGTTLAWDKLVLATGAQVRRLNAPGESLANVFYLREIADVHALRAAVVPGARAVIVGGGYIGLEVAASLRKSGLEVTVLEAQPRVLQRVTAPEVSAFYTRVHEEEGVRLLTNVAIEAIEGEGRVRSVLLRDGRRLDADLVIVGVGVLPATTLAEQVGLKVDNGIVVNEQARTSDPDIYAIGDCTRHFNPLYARWLRLESVQNANDQARTAALALCGKPEPYRALPWFWSDQFDLKLQIAGLSEGFDDVVMRGDPRQGRSFAAFYYREGRLIAVDAINRPKEFMLSKRFLASQQSADPQRIADESIDIKDCFVL